MRIGDKILRSDGLLWTVLSHDHTKVVVFVKRLDGVSDIQVLQRKRIYQHDDGVYRHDDND